MNKSIAAILTAVMLIVLGVSTSQLQAEEKSGFSKMIGSFNSSIKSGFSKVTKTISPKPSPPAPSDAISLQVKAKPSAKLYVSAANMHAANGDLKEAEEMYKRALTVSSDSADALMGYAMLKDKMGSYKDAVAMYDKAVKTHPQNAAMFNGLGLCHATHGDLNRALSALEEAVKLEPRELKYRNNIAMVLVEMGRYDDAFEHFKTQYDSSVAHYNLAYLIQKRGDKSTALKHFAAAIESNPNFSEARTWYEHLVTAKNPGMQSPTRQMPVQQATTQQIGVPQQANHSRVWLPRQQDTPQPYQSTAQREVTAQEQLNALGSASTPIRTSATATPANVDPRSMAFRPRSSDMTVGRTTETARQSFPQRLPPIEQS
ncbi:MAG: tetratricopeptide repeat protein, partial [Pirellulales bacterium]|nr:tetratricopeptide repeat protein [Pirellulales bacterium]